MKKLFGFHAATLDDSMNTVVEFSSKEDLVNIINKSFPKVNDIDVEYYTYDSRIDWNTYIVTHQVMQTYNFVCKENSVN